LEAELTSNGQSGRIYWDVANHIK